MQIDPPASRQMRSTFHFCFGVISRAKLVSQVISERSPGLERVFTEQCRGSLSMLLAAQAEEEASGRKEKRREKVVEHVDSHIHFAPLTRGGDPAHSDDVFELSMSMAVSGTKKEATSLSTSKLSKVRLVSKAGAV